MIFQAESASPHEPELKNSLKENDMLNVQLMHHFVTYTCQTSATTHKLRTLWRVQIPKLGFEHRYLLDMIFAVAALHMSREAHSDLSHIKYALGLYEVSLKESSMALSNVSSTNCNALYAFSVLAFVFEFGTLHSRESLLFNSSGSLAHWIVNSRGINAIIGSSWHYLVSGILNPMLDCSFEESGPAGIETRLQELISHIEHDFSPKAAESYLQALHELIHWSRLPNLGFYGWLCRFTNGFGDLVSRKDPYALVIFGYSCVVLKHSEPAYWIDGYPEKLLREIYECLNTSLRGWLHWPMEELGMAW